MRKHIFSLTLIAVVLGACATYQPPPPTLYIGDLPASETADLSLDNRITIEDAWALLRKGNVGKARKLFEKLGISSPFYFVGMGYASLILKEIGPAENAFLQALRLQPDMVLAHQGLAQIYEASGRMDQAFGELREVLKNEPDNSWALAKYESIRAKRTTSLLNEGKTRLASGDREGAKNAFLRALYYSPDSVEAHWNLGQLFFKEKEWNSALIYLKTASSKEPGNLEILQLYAETLFQTENYKTSLEIYEKLREAKPDDREIRNRLETIKNRLGIFELPSQYDAIPSKEAITKEDAAALIGVKFKSVLKGRVQKPPIIIDIATSWAQKYILQVASLGLLDVYSNHEFRPGGIMTRAETAEMLVRLIDYLKSQGYTFIRQVAPDQIQIRDVSPEHFYFKPIIQIISYDIMSMEADRTFQPGKAVGGRAMIKYLDVILALIQ